MNFKTSKHACNLLFAPVICHERFLNMPNFPHFHEYLKSPDKGQLFITPFNFPSFSIVSTRFNLLLVHYLSDKQCSLFSLLFYRATTLDPVQHRSLRRSIVHYKVSLTRVNGDRALLKNFTLFIPVSAACQSAWPSHTSGIAFHKSVETETRSRRQRDGRAGSAIESLANSSRNFAVGETDRSPIPLNKKYAPLVSTFPENLQTFRPCLAFQFFLN